MKFNKGKWYLPREIPNDMLFFNCEFEVRHKLYAGQYNNGEFIGVLKEDSEGEITYFAKSLVRRFRV